MSETGESAGTWQGSLEYAALTDVGLRRGNNQDSLTIAIAGDDEDWRRRGHLFMVADGMGAHAAGELASKIACESIPHTYHKLLDRSPAEALEQAMTLANANIHERGQANAEFQGMGTTCSALVLLPNSAIVGHIGDSRVYRLRNKRLEQLTFDHSLVWEMMKAGQMPRGEVASFIPKNIITRSLGPQGDVHIDLEGPFALEVNDLFLLCSDGLSGQVKDEELGAILSSLTPEQAARVLVDIANLRGGPDNISVIVARVASVPSQQAEEPEPKPIANNQAPSGHPALWGALAASLLIALGLAFSGHVIPGVVSGLVAAAILVVTLIQSMVGAPSSAHSHVNGPLGSGPHSAQDCAPNAEGVAVLCQMAQQLREAAKDEHWTLDWPQFNALGEEAQRALIAGDFTKAMHDYALAISFMMSEIRRQPARKDQRDRTVLDL